MTSSALQVISKAQLPLWFSTKPSKEPGCVVWAFGEFKRAVDACVTAIIFF